MEIHEYANGEVTLLWKPKLCIHSGICVRTLPNVYDPKARPWIRPQNATARNC
ncbi:(4Fe-4S)-binding protein [Dyadobacter sp. CY261]|uniref:(4Fe-4S)-binding protein n=1 Tax=Dyadobacter sp. CY261 TaxID=2907203 RepID=UPI001F2E424A|nr:(4Fe-4S)-binding protein [Dyadobacter sp. CY261]MCF0074872.1 (4Fe-4S)-binding protein [Dyadobacter sp. CY261]